MRIALVALVAAAAGPHHVVATAQAQWLHELRVAARIGDRDARFPSPPRGVVLRRLHAAERRYGFRIVSVRFVHAFQSAPVIVVRSDQKLALARATPAIVRFFDPQHKTIANPSGYAYEGYFFVAQTSAGVPYLATFNYQRAPRVGGGEWAESEELYPFPHW